jgi:PKHD-type hydroxylase
MPKKLEQQPNPSWAFEADKTYAWAYWNGVFSPEECKKIIDYAEQFEKEDGTVSSNNNELKPDVRNSKIVWITPTMDTQWIYQRLTDIIIKLNEDYFKFDLFGLMESLQFTEYNAPNGHYEKHIDSGYGGRIRKLSITIQLSDPKDYKGGDLQIYTEETPVTMNKEQGTLSCFPSHTLHEVTPITKGKRYSLVGWVTGKPFK